MSSPALLRAARMKKFAGNRQLSTIKAQAVAAGLEWDDNGFRDRGLDHIRIVGGGATVLYNTFNGAFFGKTDKGVHFSSGDTAHEREPWFQALLSFFYKDAA